MMSGLSYIKCASINNLQLPYLPIIDPLNHMEVHFHLNSSLSVIIDLINDSPREIRPTSDFEDLLCEKHYEKCQEYNNK